MQFILSSLLASWLIEPITALCWVCNDYDLTDSWSSWRGRHENQLLHFLMTLKTVRCTCMGPILQIPQMELWTLSKNTILIEHYVSFKNGFLAHVTNIHIPPMSSCRPFNIWKSPSGGRDSTAVLFLWSVMFLIVYATPASNGIVNTSVDCTPSF